MSHYSYSRDLSGDTLAAPPPAKNRVVRTSVSTQSLKQTPTKTMVPAMADVASVDSGGGSDGGTEEHGHSDEFQFSNEAAGASKHRALNSKSSVESMAFESGKRADSLGQMWNILEPRLINAMAGYRSLEVPTPVQWISASGTSWMDGTGEIDPDTGSLTLRNTNGSVAIKVPDLRSSIVIGTPRKRYMELIVPAAPELERAGTRLILAPTSESDFVQWLAVLLLWSHLKPAGLLSKVTNLPGSLDKGSDSIYLVTNFQVYLPFAKDSSLIEEADGSIPISARTDATVFSKQKQWKQVKGVLTKDGVFHLITGDEFDGTEREVFVVDMKSILSSRVRQVDPSLFDKRHVLYLQATGGILFDETEDFYTQMAPLSSTSSLGSVDVPHSRNSQRHSTSINPAMQEKLYISFSSEKDYEAWFCGLREFTKHRVFQSGDDMIRMTRQVTIRVVEARLEGQVKIADVFNDTYVEISFENTVWARTSVHDGADGNPYWRDSFMFNDFPIMSPSFEFLIKKRASPLGNPARDKVIGIVVVNEQAIRHSQDTETWFPVKMSKSYPQSCSICLRIAYKETRVLPADHYAKVERLLEDIPNGLTVHISEQTGDITQVSEVCLKILLTSRKSNQLAMEWLMFLIGHELRKVETHAKPSLPSTQSGESIATDAGSADTLSSSGTPVSSSSTVPPTQTYTVTNTLFRGNSLLTKGLERYMKLNAADYLESTVGNIVRKIVASGVYMEIDPERLHNHPRSAIDRTVRENQLKLDHYAGSLWSAIYNSIDLLPTSFNIIFAQLRRHLMERLNQDENVVYNSVAGFLFLRFFCPALLNPKLFGLIRSHPTPNVQRSLTLITKLLQGFANRVRFGLKEPWMIPMNSFIDAHEGELVEFYKRVTLEGVNTEDTIVNDMTGGMASLALSSEATSVGCNISVPFLIDRYENFAKLIELWSSAKHSRQCDGCGGNDMDCIACTAIDEFSDECNNLNQINKSIMRILKSAETVEDMPLSSIQMKYVPETGKVMLASTQLAQSGLRHAPLQKNGSQLSQKSQGSNGSSMGSQHSSVNSSNTSFSQPSRGGDDYSKGYGSSRTQRLRDVSFSKSSTSQDPMQSKKNSGHSIWGAGPPGHRRASGSAEDEMGERDMDQRKFRWSRFTTMRRRS